jgi:flagellin
MAGILSTQSNIIALLAQRGFRESEAIMTRASERLATGLRINRASDDPAGLAVSEKFNARIASFTQATVNVNNGISVTQIAESSLAQATNILSRLRELSVQAASTTDPAELIAIQTESTGLVQEIDRTFTTTTFNGTSIFAGSTFSFKAGVESSSSDLISFSINPQSTASLSIAGIEGVMQDPNTIVRIDAAVQRLSQERGINGGVQNRLSFALDDLLTKQEDLIDANSRIRDADIALETAQLSSAQIQNQIAASIMAQANDFPSILLSLV